MSWKYKEPELKADKGLEGGSCNRRACQAPNAIYYNKSTRAWYCECCAGLLNEVDPVTTFRLYGVFDLCTLEKP
jgi:hypothetical protein